MAGLFDGVFAPNAGWLGVPQQQPQADESVLSKLGLLFSDPFGAKVPFPGGAMSPGSDLNRFSQLFTDPFGKTVPIPGIIDQWNRADQRNSGAPMPFATGNEFAPPAVGPAAPARPLPMNVSGAPQPVANAGASRFEPEEATLPPAATTTQGVAPQQFTPQPQMQQQEPNRLSAGFGSFVGNLHNGPIAAILGGVGGAVTGKRNDPYGVSQEQQATMARAVVQSLVAQGYPPQVAIGMAQAAAQDPKIAEKLLGDAYAIPKTAEEFAVRSASGVGMPGQAKTDPFDILRRKNAAEKAGTTEGERVANAQLDLPTAVAQANEALRLAGELRTHKGRDNPVFWHSAVGGYLPDSAIPGNTDARDAVGILNQIKGGAFLEAFKALKGGGQITEVEGKKATDAIARMDRSQSKAEFDRALSDYEGVIKLGIDRANQMAGRQAPGGFQGNSGWQQVKPGVRIRQVQ